MTQVFKNNATGSLASAISNSETLLALATGHGARFPALSGADHFMLTLVGLDSNGNEAAWEIVRVTARSNDSLTVVRGQEGTTAVAWSVGTRVELRVTAGTLDSFTDTEQAAAAAPVQSVFGRTGAVALQSSDVTTALGFTPENAANKGVAGGYASLDGSGLVPANQLPSFVDDVLEYANLAAFPSIGTSGKIFVALDTGRSWRWSGSVYTEIVASPGTTDAIVEGSSNLFFTNARAQAALAGMYLPIGGGSLTGSVDLSGGLSAGTSTHYGKLNTFSNSAGSPATSGSTDAAINWRMAVSAIALDFGVYSSGVTWIQNRLSADLASNYGLALNPNGGSVGIGGVPIAGNLLSLGNTTAQSTATPVSMSLGGTYSSVAGGNLKLKVFEGNGVVYGLGVSSGSFDIVAPSAADVNLYANGVKGLTLTQYGHLLAGEAAAVAWETGTYAVKAFQLNTTNLFDRKGGSSYLSQNAYWDGAAWRYQQAIGATMLQLAASGVNMRVAAAGSPGGAITWNQFFLADANGNVTFSGNVNAQNLPGRNMIINGAMRISQRGNYSSATATSADEYHLDRHRTAISSVSGTVQHIDATLPNGRVVKALRVAATSSSGSGYLGIRHTLEDFWRISGQQITVSAWVRTNNASVGMRHDSTTDFGAKFTGNGVWQYVTRTYTCPTITQAGRDVNQTTFAIMAYNNAAVSIASGDYIEVAEWQIELGSVATPFEHRAYGTELALCQRYYWRTDNAQGILFGVVTTQTQAEYNVRFPQEMRAIPTFSFTAVGNLWCYVWSVGGARTATNAIAIFNSTRKCVVALDFGSGIDSANIGKGIAMDGNNGDFLRFSAEL